MHPSLRAPSTGRTRSILAPLALGALICASLSGCAPTAPAFTQAQLTKAVRDAGAPSGYESTRNTASNAVDSKYQQIKVGSVEPARCAELNTIGELALPAVEKGVKTNVAKLARYTAAGAASRATLTVRGRIFASAKSAMSFLDAVRDLAGTCTSGYTAKVPAQSAETSGLNVEAVVAAPVRDLPAELSGLTIDELSADSSTPAYRIVFIQRGNAMLAISASTKPSADVNYTPADELLTNLAKQLGALKPAA